jgi:hypothetical protein
MPAQRPRPEGREVDHVEAVVTVPDPSRVDEFLARCVVGSTWRARIRTAEVSAHVAERTPLGTFDERVCTCIRLNLELPVPVEPGLRFQIAAGDDPGLSATGVVRPWGS